MLLKSIKLNNIRSYVSQRISFPAGSTLLAGDIGSGKSSILAAIEFALFGLKKGELNSDSLLRHGAREGSVELDFEVDGKDVRLSRSLKRGREDIKQEDGYIIIDGKKEIGMAEELKASVLDLLGYPKEFLKKKDLIYRYTVYTPQEEMKKIIYENKDVRLDTIRRVFNIDKYKKIIENSRILTAALRERRKRLEGFTYDLDFKKREAENKNDEIAELDKKISLLSPLLEEAKSKVGLKKESIAKYEQRVSELNSLRRDYSILSSREEQSISQKNANNANIQKITRQINDLGGEIKEFDDSAIENIANSVKAKEKELKIFEPEYRDAMRSLHSFKAKHENLKEGMDSILKLDFCSVCGQKVTEEHKHSIKHREGMKIGQIEKEMLQFAAKEKELDERVRKLRQDIEDLRKEEAGLNILKIKKKTLEDKKNDRERLEKEQERLDSEIEKISGMKKEISAKMEQMQLVEELFRNAKAELDALAAEERRIELEKVGLEKEKGSIAKMLALMRKEIGEKEKSVEELKGIAALERWTEDFFVKLMVIIEKHAMLRLHSQFNGLFKEWLDVILEDETISVRLDDEFSPVIEQNGYETTIDNLSGGEKTSVALSYRLALNKVINDIVSEIKTKDLIILDEPTDGFSSEQLDKIRDVINQLNMKQIIIVSHESKIESYVNNVVRIGKNEHVSGVI